MGAFKNINSKEYFKRYGYRYGIIRGLFTRWPLHYVDDYENRKILYYLKVKNWLKRKYSEHANSDPEGLSFGKNNYDNAIWVYWKQGMENAPEIVKVCFDSIKNNSNGEVILITDENIHDYVCFPKFIEDKILGNKMSAVAFSDLLRFTLLEHYGGTWIDATVLLSSKIPSFYTNCELFMLRDSIGPIYNAANLSVWFLHSSPGNIIIRETRNITYEYWRTHNTVVEYLLPYVIITMISEKYPNIITKMPYASNEYALILLNRLNEKYDKSKVEYIKYLSWIHKLSYKLSDNVFSDQNNVYHHIISDGSL